MGRGVDVSTATDLVTRLQARGVVLMALGDKLRFAPKDALSAADLDALRQHKPVIIALLTGKCVPCVHQREDIMYVLAGDGCPACGWTLCAKCHGCLRARFHPYADTEPGVKPPVCACPRESWEQVRRGGRCPDCRGRWHCPQCVGCRACRLRHDEASGGRPER